MKAFIFESEGERILINPLHIVFAKQIDTKLVIKMSDGTVFEKEYSDASKAESALVQIHWDCVPSVSKALVSISVDK